MINYVIDAGSGAGPCRRGVTATGYVWLAHATAARVTALVLVPVHTAQVHGLDPTTVMTLVSALGH